MNHLSTSKNKWLSFPCTIQVYIVPTPPAFLLAHRSILSTLSILYFLPSSQTNKIGIRQPSLLNSATTSTYTLFMPHLHHRISIALGDAGTLRIYPLFSNCLILENTVDVEATPSNAPSSLTVGGNPCSSVNLTMH